MFGASETVIIVAVAFVLFGPDKMPEIGRSIGKALRELHKVRDEFMDGIDPDIREIRNIRLDLDDDKPNHPKN